MAEDWRKLTGVREGEFEVADDRVVHVPSGAVFWANTDSSEPYEVDWGSAKDLDEDDNPLFDEGYIDYVARELLKIRLG
ncbi:MAG: hypothetical protein R3D68_09065 [Hyphomicrobiaceae bacterium]